MTSSQDNFYALQLLGFQGQRVTKSTATKSKLNTLRHFSEDLRTVQDERTSTRVTTSTRSNASPRPCTNLATFRTRADVPLPVRRSAVPPLTRVTTRVTRLSVSQILAHNFEDVMVTYASIFTGPQAQIPSSPYQQGLGLVRGYGAAGASSRR